MKIKCILTTVKGKLQQGILSFTKTKSNIIEFLSKLLSNLYKKISDLFFIRLIIYLALMVLLFSLVLGFKTDSKNFISNFLAEIVGLCLGVILTVYIVERFLQAERDRKVKGIRDFSYWLISQEIIRIISKFCITFGITGGNALLESISLDVAFRKGVISKHTLIILSDFLRLLEKNITTLHEDINDSYITNFYEAVEPNLRTITDVLIPRLIQLSGDSEDYRLVDILITFESMASVNRNDYPLFKQGQISISSFLNHIVSLMNACHQVLSSICNRIDDSHKNTIEKGQNKHAENNRDLSPDKFGAYKEVFDKMVVNQGRNSQTDRRFFEELKKYESTLNTLKKQRKIELTPSEKDVLRKTANLIRNYIADKEEVLQFEKDIWREYVLEVSRITLLNIKDPKIITDIRESLGKYMQGCIVLTTPSASWIQYFSKLRGYDLELDVLIDNYEKYFDKSIELNEAKISDIKKAIHLLDIKLGHKDN